ncbi:MAG: membrane protein insertion efficiency factor YidD [Gaiellales bacterium]
MTRLVIWMLRLVRTAMIPFASMTSVTPRVCKYEPTCSHYAEDAIHAHGPLRGLAMATWRLLRCNPWSKGGYDPVRRP